MKKRISWEIFNPKKDDEDSHVDTIIIPHNIEMMNIYDNFNVFTGHCNFYITLPIAKYLNNVIGIESLEILSPYRFRISVGKLFAPQEILDEIKQNLTEETNGEKS